MVCVFRMALKRINKNGNLVPTKRFLGERNQVESVSFDSMQNILTYLSILLTPVRNDFFTFFLRE